MLAYEHEWYLRGRGGERGMEPPLALAERQEYVYYHKGALAMHALRDAVGEERLNQALAAHSGQSGQLIAQRPIELGAATSLAVLPSDEADAV